MDLYYMLDQIVIILQGYEKTKGQLRQNIKYFMKQGFTKIVVSTYSNYLKSIEDLPVKIVLNDVNSPLISAKTKRKDTRNLRINFEESYYPLPDEDYAWKTKFKGRRNKILETYIHSINCQLQTTRRGINCALEHFGDIKYYFKTRAELTFQKENFVRWIKQINNTHKLVFNYFNPKGFVSDSILFGYREDVVEYYQTPLIKKFTDLKRIKQGIAEWFLLESYLERKDPNYQKLSFTEIKKKYIIFNK